MRLIIIGTCIYLLWQIVVNLLCNFREQDRESYIIRVVFVVIETIILTGQIWLGINLR